MDMELLSLETLVLGLDSRADVGGREDGEDEGLDRDDDADLEHVDERRERDERDDADGDKDALQ